MLHLFSLAFRDIGGAVTIPELLLQSHAGEKHLLPCLPDKLSIGKLSELMIRDGQ